MWPEPAPYLVGCLKLLLSEYNVKLLMIVSRIENSKAYLDLQKFNNSIFIDLSEYRTSSFNDIKKIIADFKPAIALITTKKAGVFSETAKFVQDMGGLVIGANDHYWKNSWRDYANALVARFGIFRAYDVILVTGALGRIYARRLGFQDSRIFEGLYSCEAQLFRVVGEARFAEGQNCNWPQVFLFIGQFIPRKGLSVLLKAYSEYRNSVKNPWDLWCVGKGPLSNLLTNLPGVKNLGYQSHEECARLMGKAGVFILPSYEDHWGVVIHEAVCAGLPILATHECGACVELVRSSYNGFTFPANNNNRLAQLMLYISENSRAFEMGKNSLKMSYQIDPKPWARRILEEIPLSVRGYSLLGE